MAKTIENNGCPVENLCYNHFNDLMAISTSDLSVTILNAKKLPFVEVDGMNPDHRER